MLELSLSLLGSFEAEYDGQPLVKFRTRAVQALLIYLICAPDAHTRDSLMTLFWPEAPQKSAQASLRHALYHLRRRIPELEDDAGKQVPFLIANRQTVQLNPNGRFDTDINRFETLSASHKVADWETAVAHYRNDFLTDFYLPDSPHFESWAQNRRGDLRRRYLDTLSRLTDHFLANGDFENAEQTARTQLTVDNLREDAHRQLMMVFAKNGRRSAALVHYQNLKALLKRELGIAPSNQTAALAATLRKEGLIAETNNKKQKSKTSQPIIHNLPTQVTPFVGRQEELAALNDLFTHSQARLVTILGTGGMGKTRLSLALAERFVAEHHFTNGVFFVPLAGLSESEHIVPAIAEALQIRLERGESQLLNYLQTKQMLLMLDNFEHLSAGGELVSRLLQAAPHIKILITSRERLRLHGEHVYPLHGLALDDTAESDDARTLFLQALRRLQPTFTVTVENLSILNQICRLVEGMPLALELAAAWVDVLTPTEIAAEIERSLDFLSTNLRDAPPRHRSIRAVFDASWQRLSPNEQQLLAQITIFKGGFTREAITAVTGGALGDLASLVNKSLVRLDVGNGRYHIHELLRQYAARQRLYDDSLRDDHAAYYCAWLAAQYDGLIGAKQMAVARHIQADMSNVRTALTHTLQKNQFTELEKVLFALGCYYDVSSQFQEGIDLLERILSILKTQSGPASLAHFWVLIWLSQFYGHLNQAALCKPLLQQANALLEAPFFQQKERQTERAMLLYQEAYRILPPEPANAVKLFRESHLLIEPLGEVWIARNLLGLARAERNTGDLISAKETVLHCLALARSIGNLLLQAEAQLVLGQLSHYLGKLSEAEAQLQVAITQVRSLNHPHLLTVGLIYLMTTQTSNGRFSASLQSCLECQQVSQETGNWGSTLTAQLKEAQNWIHLGDYTRSRLLGQAVRDAIQTTQTHQLYPQSYLELKLLFGRLAITSGEIDLARRQLTVDNEWAWLGIAVALDGDLSEAWALSVKTIDVALAQRHVQKLAIALTLAAYLKAMQGEQEEGLMLYAVARQHPFVANSRWFADVVERRIIAVTKTLPPDRVRATQMKGESSDIWQIGQAILENSEQGE